MFFSLTHRIQTELDRGKENEVPGILRSQHNRYDQKYLRERLRSGGRAKGKGYWTKWMPKALGRLQIGEKHEKSI